MSDSDVYEVTCPKCGKTHQLRRVDRRARTCPHCGHVGARESFPERKLGDDAPAPGGNGEQPPAPSSSAPPPPPPPAKPRKLGGAAKLAHEQKQRGEPVTIGKLRRGNTDAKRAPAPAAAAAAASSGSSSSSAAPRPSLRERLARIL